MDNTVLTRHVIQCEAHTRQGHGPRCKKRTAFGNFCWQHQISVSGIRVKKSGIPNGGKGLFTTIPRERNDTVVDYKGKIMDESTFVREYPSGDRYGIQIGRKVIVPQKTTDSYGFYVNSARPQDVRAGLVQGNNLKWSISRPRRGEIDLKMKANRNIPANRELFVSYGRDYFRQFH